MPVRPTLALLLALALPLAACGGDDGGDFDGDVEETGEPGVLGRMGELQGAMEEMQEAAERPPAEPVNFRVLRDLLPAEVEGIAQAEAEGSTDGAMGFSISQARAEYPGDDGARLTVAIMDYGALPSMGMMGLGWTMTTIDRESGSTYERTVTFGGERGYREYDADARRGQFSLSVADRFVVQVEGQDVDDAMLEAALRAVDLDGLAALRDEGRPDA